MAKQQEAPHSKYWGILAPENAYKTFRKSGNLVSLLQAPYQKAGMAPDSAWGNTNMALAIVQDTIPGSDTSDQSSKTDRV